jgi:hypothetical protein
VKRRPDEHAEHELEHRLFAEAVGNDLQPSPFLDEQPFEEIRRPCEATVRDREPQVRDAGLEIVLETGERTGQDVGVIGINAVLAAAGYNFRRLLAWLPALWRVFIMTILAVA